MVWIEFLLSAAVIIFAGTKLTTYADIVADRLGAGKVWIGVLLLGIVTSLPEAVATIVAAFQLGANDLAVGNIVGSNNFNPVMLVVLDVIYRQGSITGRIGYSRENARPIVYSAVLMLVLMAQMFLDGATRMPVVLGAGIGSWLICGIYLFGMYKISTRQEAEAGEFTHRLPEAGQPPSRIYLGLALSSAVVVLAATRLTQSAEQIAEMTGLGQTFVGTLLLAFVTSLPELVVTVAALRMGVTGLAVGNIFGSNMTNVFILFVCDLAYGPGTLYQGVSRAHLWTGFLSLVLTGIAVWGMKNKQKKTFGGVGVDAIMMVICFVFGFGVLYYIS